MVAICLKRYIKHRLKQMSKENDGCRKFTSIPSVTCSFEFTPSLTNAAHSSCCMRLIQKVPSLPSPCQILTSAALGPKLSRNCRLNPTLHENMYTSSIGIHSGSFSICLLISSGSNDVNGGQDTAVAPSFVMAALLLRESVRSATSLALLGLVAIPSHPLLANERVLL